LPLLKTLEGPILASNEPESGECRTKRIFELKSDGFRGLCYVGRGRGWFISRNGKRMTRFAEFADQLARDIDIHDAVFDGEVIASDDTGRPQFYELLWRSRRPTYVAFDLLWLNGADLRALPLSERRRRLQAVLPQESLALSHFRKGCRSRSAVGSSSGLSDNPDCGGCR